MLEQKQGLELDSEFPHHLGELSPLQTRSSLGPEAVFPPSDWEFPSSRGCLLHQTGSSLGAENVPP